MVLKSELFDIMKGKEIDLPSTRVRRLGRNAGSFLGLGRYLLKNHNPEKLAEDPEKIRKILLGLSQLKGIAMKMGQIMSYIDVAIPDELRDALSLLQTQSPSMPAEQVFRIVRDELPPERAEPLIAHMEPEAIAAASIGQVHRAEVEGRKVAVKVQYPEIEKAIRSDFSFTKMAGPIGAVFAPGANVTDFVDEARRVFLAECDYLNEAKNQADFCALYAGHPYIVVPRVLADYSSRKVLVSEYVDGISLADFLAGNPDEESRNHVGTQLFEFYMGALFRYGLYNGDPHPGNYLFLPDRRIAILDYGCVIRFDDAFLKKMHRLAGAVYLDDPALLRQSYEELGMTRPGRPYKEALAREFLRAYFGPLLEDREQVITLRQLGDLREVARNKQQIIKLNIPKEFMFLFRIRFGLFSILSQIGAKRNWNRLERGFILPVVF